MELPHLTIDTRSIHARGRCQRLIILDRKKAGDANGARYATVKLAARTNPGVRHKSLKVYLSHSNVARASVRETPDNPMSNPQRPPVLVTRTVPESVRLCSDRVWRLKSPSAFQPYAPGTGPIPSLCALPPAVPAHSVDYSVDYTRWR